MVFGGGILGGARNFWGNPYLNSTTVLFDTLHEQAIQWLFNLSRYFAKAINNSFLKHTFYQQQERIQTFKRRVPLWSIVITSSVFMI